MKTILKKAKRTLSLLLAILMTVSMTVSFAIPITAETTAYPVEGGNIYFDPTTGTITDSDITVTRADIPSKINGVDVTNIGNSAFESCKSLASVTIPDGVTSIGLSGFEYCYALTSINIPYSVTSIGNYAFFGCKALKSITIPSSVTSIGVMAFQNCTSLESINITNGVTKINRMTFYGCTSLKSIIFPQSVTIIGDNIVWGCNSLESIILHNSITTIEGAAFEGCNNLKTIYYTGSKEEWIEITKYDNSIPDSVEIIYNYTYSSCDHVWGEWVVTTEPGCVIEGEEQRNCTSCDSFEIQSVPAIGTHTWGEWVEITQPSLPDKGLMRRNCVNCTAFETSPILIAYPVVGGNIYFNFLTGAICDSDEWVVEVKIPSEINGVDVTSIDWKAFENCDSLTSITIPDSVTSIGSYAFLNCTSLESITIPNGVTSISEYTFVNCESLTSITIPDSVTKIGTYAFWSCTSLESIIIPDGVTRIENFTFDSCKSLTSITIPESVTNIGAYAFYRCTSLESIIIPDGVMSIGEYTFYNCTSLTSISIPDSVKSIGEYAFCGCTSLESIAIPDGVINIDKYAFVSCSALTSVTIPSGVTTIEEGVFNSCQNLKSITIPDSVMKIDSAAFEYCTSLESIIIPNSVTSIGTRAFINCKSLKSVYYCGDNDSWNKISIKTDNEELINATRFYHDYTDWLTVIEPGCDTDGEETRNCLICGKIESQVVPAGHDIVKHDSKDATCTDIGWDAYDTCSRCDYSTYVEIPLLGHSFGEWEVTTAPTTETEGVKSRSCANCGAVETESIPKIQEFSISIENYTIKMTGAENINYIRYAPGIFNTSNEIRNAEGMVPINTSVIVENTVNGVYIREMPTGGVYSFWIRFNDGTTKIEHVDITRMTQSISVKGLMMTVHNLYGVKDYFIAKGNYSSYRELKNDYVMRVTASRINGAKEFTYALKEPGYYTVCVRYDDPTRADLFLYYDVDVIMPEIVVDGLQVTVSNLDDLQVIRTAPGEWETTGEVKRAEGNRNFTARSAVKDSDPYTIQYYEDGIYTISLEYTTGLKVVRTIEIKHKEPTFEQNGNSVTFGELDDLYVIRYVKGEYATIGEVKRATGSKYKKPTHIVDGKITIDGLESGVYTFCVQYNDQSTNYYTVKVEE